MTVAAVAHGEIARTLADVPTVSWMAMITVLAGTLAAFLLLLKTTRGTTLFAALFAAALFAGIGAIVAPSLGGGRAVVIVAIAVFAYYGAPSVAVYDLIVLVGVAGIATTVGPSFTPVAVLAAMGVLALYDVIADRAAKHRTRISGMLLRRKVFFAMIMPQTPRALRTRSRDVGPEGGFSFLGTGDLLLPALLVSSMTARYGTVPALSVAGGVVAGFIALVLLSPKNGDRPMAVLPPLVVGAAIGYVIALAFQ